MKIANPRQSVLNQTEVKTYFQSLLSPNINKVHPDTSKSYSQLLSNDKSADTLNVDDPSTIRMKKENEAATPKLFDKYDVFNDAKKKSSVNFQVPEDKAPKIRLSEIPALSFGGLTKMTKMVGKIAKNAIVDMNKSVHRKSIFKGEDYERNLKTTFKLLDVSGTQSPFIKIVKQFIFFNIQIFIFFMNLLSIINMVLVSNFKIGSLDDNWESFLVLTEWIVGFNFGFEILMTLISAKGIQDIVRSLFSYELISNVLLIIEIIDATTQCTDFKRTNKFLTVVYILRSFRLIKLRMIITYTLKEFRKLVLNDKIQIDTKNDQSEIKYFVYSLAIDIAIAIFIQASIYIAVDELCDFGGYGTTSGAITVTYISAAYYSIVTLTTIGYGDIYPLTTFSRCCAVLTMLFNIFVLSTFLSKMAEKMYELSPFIRNFYYKNHIVIIGELPLSFTKYFIRELYQCDFLTSQVYKNGGKSVSRIILVGKETPSRDLETWLEDFSSDFTEIKYLKSNYLEGLWHKQTNLGFARHLFAFSMNLNDSQAQGVESDKQMSYNIQKVVNSFPKLEITLVLSTEFSNQIKNDSLWAKVTVISAPILNEYIMANSLENQGMNIWLTHLATLREKNEIIHGSETNHLEEYAKNMAQEIYPIKLPPYFEGKTFQEAIKLIYFSCFDLSESFSFDYTDFNSSSRKNLPNRSGILLLGIEHYEKDELDNMQSRFMINPVNYRIEKDDIAYVVAYDQENAKTILNYSEKSSLLSTYNKNMNLFRKLKIVEASYRFVDKMRVQMNENLTDWKINKQKYFKKNHLGTISDYDSNLYEIPFVYNLFNNQTPKGVFKNHIIIRGELSRLKRIASVLRSYSERPILLFSDQPLNPSEWNKVREFFKNVFYVLGCPTNINHLIQINPKKAYKILILSSNENRFIMDSESIVFTRIISDFFETNNFLTELTDENNMRYISINPKYESKNFFFWPYFIRGNVHFSSLAMSIIAKSINNKSWFSFIRNVTKPPSANPEYKNDFLQNSKINTFTITPEIKKEFQFFGQLQYVMMSNDPPVIGIAVLKEKFISKPPPTSLLGQVTLNSPSLKQHAGSKSFQILTSHILKVMDNFYGSEFLMTNPSFLMPLDVGDKVLIIGNTRLEEVNEYSNKMVSSSFRLSSPNDKDASRSNKSKEENFNFSLMGTESTTQQHKKEKIGIFKEKLNENLSNLNDLMKFILNNWEDINGKKTITQ